MTDRVEAMVVGRLQERHLEDVRFTQSVRWRLDTGAVVVADVEDAFARSGRRVRIERPVVRALQLTRVLDRRREVNFALMSRGDHGFGPFVAIARRHFSVHERVAVAVDGHVHERRFPVGVYGNVW